MAKKKTNNQKKTNTSNQTSQTNAEKEQVVQEAAVTETKEEVAGAETPETVEAKEEEVTETVEAKEEETTETAVKEVQLIETGVQDSKVRKARKEYISIDLPAKETKKKVVPMDIVLLLVSLWMFFGVKLVFHACEAMDSESIMACHWAEQLIFGVAGVLVLQSILLIATARKGTRLGISLSMIPTALLTTVIPGTLVKLCMMNTMRCQSVMKPAVITMGIVTAICALTNAILEWRES